MGGCFVHTLLIWILKKRGLGETSSDELIEALAKYLHQTGLRKKSGEKGLFVLLGIGLIGKRPLVDSFEKGAPFPVCFQYG